MRYHIDLTSSEFDAGSSRVIGATGVGKSSVKYSFVSLATSTKFGGQFINIAIGSGLTATIDHDLDLCTHKVQTLRCRHPFEPDGNAIVLVDTPGFEQDHKADFEVLQVIADWLKTM